MLIYLAAAAASWAVADQTPPAAAPDPCAGQANCTPANAAQLFALADRLFAAGDLAGAADLLEALTQDPHPELRAEARFRLAVVREKLGDIDGAIASLRDLIREQPGANPARLELARLLARKGDAAAARLELRRAQAIGLPPEVQQTVQRFSATLRSAKRRGLSLELAAGPDSNINRSTSDRYIDTVIAPFELNPDARGHSGIGLSLGGQAWSRNALLGVDLLSRVGAHGDFFGKSRFNDIQLSLSTGPEFATRSGRIRPAVLHERRWYGGHAYSAATGGALNWLITPSANSQIELDGSIVRQLIRNNAVLDGMRYSLGVAYDRAFSARTSGRFALRGSALDAEARSESIRQVGGDFTIARRFDPATLFVQGGYSKTVGLVPLSLFGRTRDDDRVDLVAGVIAHRFVYSGFSPMVRLSHTRSRSNIELYDYRRTRLDLGLSRDF
jgi:tetratricopeptide (TPR) repeat protein